MSKRSAMSEGSTEPRLQQADATDRSPHLNLYWTAGGLDCLSDPIAE